MHSGALQKYLWCALAVVIAGARWVNPNQSLAAPPGALSVRSDFDTSPPEQTVKLVFVHASIGAAWLGPNGGRLGSSPEANGYSLTENNYFVSDYNVNDPNNTLARHDYCAWKDIFDEPSWMDLFLNHSTKEGSYDRLADPGGLNDIIMIKPCATQYPIYGDPDDPPGGTCPPGGSGWTVAQVKQAMLDTLESLRDYPDTFFVLVTAPPKCYPGVNGCVGSYDPAYDGTNARAVANWMVNDLLHDYDVGNVFVFDLYNALTSNHEGEGDTCPEDDTASDVGLDTGNHHRMWNTQVQHQVQYDQNYSAYCVGHPKPGGLRKATREFVPLLNSAYNAWASGEDPLRADFTGEPRSGLMPLTVQFTDTSVGAPTAWSWDFGDAGSMSTQQHPTHTYSAPGSYTVTLTVTRAEPAATDALIQPDYIAAVEAGVSADANGPYSGTEGSPISLDASASTAPDGEPLSYEWDLDGDGAHDDASGVSPSHTWTADGTYTIGLLVTSTDNVTDTDNAQVIVTDVDPTADFAGVPRLGLAPLNVAFSDLSASYDGITSWQWTFGDGTISTEANPNHRYTVPDAYTVTLSIGEADADTDTVTKTNYITVADMLHGVYLPLILRNPGP